MTVKTLNLSADDAAYIIAEGYNIRKLVEFMLDSSRQGLLEQETLNELKAGSRRPSVRTKSVPQVVAPPAVTKSVLRSQVPVRARKLPPVRPKA